MITNYTKPQLVIKQILERLDDTADPSMNAFVLGPQYTLHRVTNSEEFAEKTGVFFQEVDDGQVQVVPFEELDEDNPVDVDYTRLYGEKLEGRLVKYGLYDVDDADETQDSTLTPFIKSVGESSQILFKTSEGGVAVMSTVGGGTLDPSLKGRPVTVGDTVYLKFNGEVVKRVVSGVERAVTTPEATEVEAASANPEATSEGGGPLSLSPTGATGTLTFTPTSADELAYADAGSVYGGEFAERFHLTVTAVATDTTEAKFSISTASGNFSASDVECTDETNAWNITDDSMPGVTVAVNKASLNDGDGFHLGDSIGFTIKLQYERLEDEDFEFFGEANYAYDEDTTLIFEVTSTNGGSNQYDGGTLRISDTAGLLTPQSVSLSKDDGNDRSEIVIVGNSGLSFRLKGLDGMTGVSLRKGDFYTKEMKIGKADGVYGVVSLNGPAGNTSGISDTGETFNSHLELKAVDFRKIYTGFIDTYADTSTAQWTVDPDRYVDGVENPQYGINVNPDVAIYDSVRSAGNNWLRVTSDHVRDAKLYVHYRALVAAKTNEEISFCNNAVSQNYGTSYSDYGKIDIDNPLGFGVNCALSGSQGKGIYVGRLENESLESWGRVLEKAEKNSNIYAICPLTDDLAVQQLVASHVTAMSQEKVKRWRRAYVGVDSPLEYAVVETGEDGMTRPTATVSELDGKNVRVRDEDGRFLSRLVTSGDVFRYEYETTSTGGEGYEEYVVDYVLGEEELVLKSGPENPQPVPVQYEVWKDDAAGNVVDYVATRSASFANRRVVNVWVDHPLYNDGNSLVELKNYYIAAEMAGLRSAVQPQQGLTRTEVRFVGMAPSMYTKFTESDLDEVAASGTWVVTQEYEGGARFIRHQLTTSTNNGNLYYEDSVGTNLDEISYAINNRLLGYIGKRNANAETVIEIYNDVFGTLADRTTAQAGVTVGAALMGFSNLEVKIDDVFKDRVNVNVDLTLPLPLNTIEVTLNAIASFGDLSVTQTATVLGKDGMDRILDTSDLTYN